MALDGAIVLIYYKDLYLMGKETSYLTDESIISENLFDLFLFKGDSLDEAHIYFNNICIKLEKIYKIKITYADVKESKRHLGYISAKPRYVKESRKHLFGFPKGSHEHFDTDLKETVKRECFEETSIILDSDRIEYTNKNAPTGKTSKYAIYQYKIISDQEFNIFKQNIKQKNMSKENELHDIQFLKIPIGDPRNFFTNVVSKEAYERTRLSMGGRKTRRKKLISR